MKAKILLGVALAAVAIAIMFAPARAQAWPAPSPDATEALDEFCYYYRGDIYTYPDVTFDADSWLVTSVTPTCNYRARKGGVVAIVLHFTEGPASSAVHTFREMNGASAHYILAKDGRLIQMVPEQKAAFHVLQTGPLFCKHRGVCSANGGDLASSTIGIEIENLGSLREVTSPDSDDARYVNQFGFEAVDPFVWDGSPLLHRYRYWDAYPDSQLAVLQMLIDDIRVRHPGIRWVVGHSDLQQKGDPGPALAAFLAVQAERMPESIRKPFLP